MLSKMEDSEHKKWNLERKAYTPKYPKTSLLWNSRNQDADPPQVSGWHKEEQGSQLRKVLYGGFLKWVHLVAGLVYGKSYKMNYWVIPP